MISAMEILRIASETKDAGKIELLWHLHSFVVEGGGPERFHRELQQWFPERSNDLWRCGYGEDVLRASLDYLRGFGVGTRAQKFFNEILYEHLARSKKEAREKIHLTNIGRKVWEQLDECLEERIPVFLEGLQGRGKSEAAKAWFDGHRGQARYATLYGVSKQRDFYTALAEPWGLAHIHANSASAIRFRVQDVMVRAGLAVIIDEAHFALNERAQAGRPANIDWIDTALCNHNIPVALLSTPQFGPRLAEFVNDTTYNAEQFKRRFARRWTRLDDRTSEKDLIALTKRALPDVGAKGVELALNYASTFNRDVSALFDLVRDAKARARKVGRSSATFQDVRDAYNLDRLPSENAMAAAFAVPDRAQKKPAKAANPARAAEPAQLAGSRPADVFNAGTGTRRQEINPVTT